MRAKINEIRTLLSQLESEVGQAEKATDFRALSGLELPDIICDVVDLLMPELKPYELSLYVYFLRHLNHPKWRTIRSCEPARSPIWYR
jgi:hypothetical protein